MEAERTYQNKVARTIQQKRNGEGALEFADNRSHGILQAVAEPVQRQEEEDTLQGKFVQPVQREEDDDEALQANSNSPYRRRTKPACPIT